MWGKRLAVCRQLRVGKAPQAVAARFEMCPVRRLLNNMLVVLLYAPQARRKNLQCAGKRGRKALKILRGAGKNAVRLKTGARFDRVGAARMVASRRLAPSFSRRGVELRIVAEDT